MLASDATLSDRERLAQRYFFAGFVGLPWLWGYNALWLWPRRHESAVLRRYLRVSIVAFAVAAIAFVTWSAEFRLCCADSSLWIIRPGSSQKQAGLYSDAVFNDIPS